MKILVVDDSLLFRRVMVEALSTFPGVEVVGQVPNGTLALQKVQELEPDLVTLDMEMPGMDGLAVLDALKNLGRIPQIIVVSALTKRGGRLALQALEKGAFDFITKPEGTSSSESLKILVQELGPRVKALDLRLGVRNILRGGQKSGGGVPDTGSPKASSTLSTAKPAASARTAADSGSVASRMNRLAEKQSFSLVLIGVSTGGPNALLSLIPALPRLGVPVLLVQHMPPLFTQTLADNLAQKSNLAVKEASHDEVALKDTVYIAPGGRHMRLVPGSQGEKRIQITDEPPENNCRPSVDYLFRSVSLHFPSQALCLILTGMGNDGTLGLRLLKRQGAHVLAQDEQSCVVYGMPKAAVEAGVVDEVLPLEAMAARVTALLRGGA